MIGAQKEGRSGTGTKAGWRGGPANEWEQLKYTMILRSSHPPRRAEEYGEDHY